jgi:hypothetical protein
MFARTDPPACALSLAVSAQIALLIYSMTNSVMFGAGLIFVLMVPALNENAG